MRRIFNILFAPVLVLLLLGGCAMRTVEDMYAPPRRSAEYEDLQLAIDRAMEGMDYAAPLAGEYRQSVQMADLDGDGVDEYLLFAKDTSENPMKVLIFSRDEEGCCLRETIECRGAAFDVVNYVDLDGKPGKELVLGRQVSNLILRTVSVYTFADGSARRLMSVNYSRIVPADLDGNGVADLMIITRGESDVDNAVATLYSFQDGAMVRSREASLSASSDRIKRIMVSYLYGNVPSVYVASNVNDSAIITDVFALRNGEFTNISFSNESGTSVRTLRNYYVYADDIDSDGVLELPDLIDMRPVENTWSASNQKLIRWYAMDIMGREVDRMYTFHNFDGGWYLTLEGETVPGISAIQKDGATVFYIWDTELDTPEMLMSLKVLTGTDREELAQEEGYYILHRAEGAIFALKTEDAATLLGLTPEYIAQSFHLIQLDWKNGET